MGLVERAGQLATLVDQLGQVNGAGRLVLVSGEAGAGKTALVEAFCADHLDGHRVLVGRCDDLFAPRPLGPIADIARQAPGPLATALASGDQGAVLDAFLAELVGGPPPAVVVLEDLQWADEASLDLLRFVARRLDSLPCLVIATHRDDLASDHPLRRAYGSLVGPLVTRLALPALSLDGVRALVGDRAVDAVTLHTRTGGNAFFVTEALAGGGTLPDTVRDAINGRAALLSGAARDALDAAAVLGRQVTPELLCAVGDCAVDAVDECLAAGLLVDDDGRQTFRHDLAREAVESAMTPLRRRQLHARALDALGDHGDIVQRAHHAVGAGDAEAIPVLAAAAADRCIALGAHVQAATLYGCALDHPTSLDPSERRRLLEARARTCERVELIQDAVLAAEELRGLLGDVGDELELGATEAWMGCLLQGAGRFDDGWSMLGSAIARLEALPPSPAFARALGGLAANHMVIGEFEESIGAAERALEIAASLHEDAEAEAVYALGIKGVSVALARSTDDGIELMHDALARAKAADLARDVSLISANLANLHYGQDDPVATLPLLDEAIRVAEANEMDHRRNCSLAERAGVFLTLGRWDEAMADITSVLSQPRLGPHNEAYTRQRLGQLRSLRGDPGAREELESALRELLVSEQPQLIVPARLAVAEDAWLNGDLPTAASEVAACMPMLRALEAHVVRSVAIWAHRTGVSWPADTPVPTPGDHFVAGAVREAAAYWDARSYPYLAADALGDSDDVDDLREAHERLLALGARPRAQMVARRMRDLGAREVPRGPRASTRANAAGLTARELEVAGLLAAGRTNAEIADQLVLSPKTVDHHVSAVLGKLSVRSRREVADAAAAQGVDLKDGVVAAAT